MSAGLIATKLPVAGWAKLMGINPIHFMGVQIPQMQTRGCDSAWYQYPWQTAQLISREDVAEAIHEAETMIESLVGYRLLPSWETERVATARDYQAAFVAPQPFMLPNPVGPFLWPGGDIRGYRNTVNATWHRFISGGVRASTLLAAAAAITWSNNGRPPTSYKGIGTVTATVPTGTSAEQVRLYYPGHAGEERWRIMPVSVSITGSTATATFARELAVIEDIIESMDREADSNAKIADGDQDADFLTTVDVYRVSNNGGVQATLLWEQPPAVCDPSAPYDADAFISTDGMLLNRDDPRFGILSYQRGAWDATTQTWHATGGGLGRVPDQLILNYFAGYEDPAATFPRNDLDPFLAQTVAMLAASLMRNKGCLCSSVVMGRWQDDLAISAGNDGGSFSRYQTTAKILECPWGTRRGAVMAYARMTAEGPYTGVNVYPF